MSDKTSENFRLSKLERQFEEKYYKCKAGADFREYLVELLTREMAGSQNKEIEKFIHSLLSDIEKLNIQAAENLKGYEKAKEDFKNLFEENTETKLPEEILKLGDNAVVIIEKSEEKNKDYLNQSALCNEFASFVKKIEKLVSKSENEHTREILQKVLETLAFERANQAVVLEKMKSEYKALDTESMSAIREVIDAIDSFEKGRYVQKQKE